MKAISAVLITQDEEAKIGRALRSLEKIADEIVVVDSGSTDRTVEICRQAGARVTYHPWQGYRQQSQYATDLAQNDWVLSLDADECVSTSLRRELQAWKKAPETPHNGFFVARKTFFLGRWIDHTTWFPDWQLRLFRKSCGSWQGGRVHEAFKVEGETGRLANVLEHYTYSDISEYLSQLERFSSLAAADYYDNGRRSNWTHLTLYPALAFVNNLVIRRGFLDGIPGLAVSTLSAVSVFFKYLKLWELEHSTKKTEGAGR